MELITAMRYLIMRNCSCDPKSRRTACRAEVQLPLPSFGLGANRIAGHPFLVFPRHRPQNKVALVGADFPQHVFQFRLNFGAANLSGHGISVNVGDLNQTAPARIEKTRFYFRRGANFSIQPTDRRFKLFLCWFRLNIFVHPQLFDRHERQKPRQHSQRQQCRELIGRRQLSAAAQRHRRFVDDQDSQPHFQFQGHFQNRRDCRIRHLVSVKLFIPFHSQLRTNALTRFIKQVKFRESCQANAINVHRSARFIWRARPIASSEENFWHSRQLYFSDANTVLGEETESINLHTVDEGDTLFGESRKRLKLCELHRVSSSFRFNRALSALTPKFNRSYHA